MDRPHASDSPTCGRSRCTYLSTSLHHWLRGAPKKRERPGPSSLLCKWAEQTSAAVEKVLGQNLGDAANCKPAGVQAMQGFEGCV